MFARESSPTGPGRRLVGGPRGAVAVQVGDLGLFHDARVLDRLVGAVGGRIGREELRVVGPAAVARGLQDDLGPSLVDGLDEAVRRERADLRLPGRHRGDERGVVARDDPTDGDAQLLGQIVHERLDVLDEGLRFAGRDESHDELRGIGRVFLRADGRTREHRGRHDGGGKEPQASTSMHRSPPT